MDWAPSNRHRSAPHNMLTSGEVSSDGAGGEPRRSPRCRTLGRTRRTTETPVERIFAHTMGVVGRLASFFSSVLLARRVLSEESHASSGIAPRSFAPIERRMAIGFIAASIAMLRPAVQSARGAARCARCTDDLGRVVPAVADVGCSDGLSPSGSGTERVCPQELGPSSCDAGRVIRVKRPRTKELGLMSQQISRRSILRVASGTSLLAAWFVAGCSKEEAPDQTGEAKSLDESALKQRARRKGATAPPAPTQRLKGERG
jgi:hypothetical protein